MQKLSNRYFVMRHGQSEANIAGVIASDPNVGCTAYGLTETGKTQVAESIASSSNITANTHILSSDFLRARETAEIVHKAIKGTYPLHFTEKLRERFFGELNGQSDDHYQEAWTLDRDNPDHHEFGVESANDVVARTAELIGVLEKQFSNETFLLIAHGDVLQLLQSWFQGVPASEHRQLPHLDTAEIRRLNTAESPE
ncbi:MAG TPA: histidine phosphatase family protein [Porticoccus sp.]|nr:histidine phosphatase family protein [Porticoccus sp.]